TRETGDSIWTDAGSQAGYLAGHLVSFSPDFRRRYTPGSTPRPIRAPASRSCVGLRRREVMSYEISEIATIRKYLLGDLPESEVERIERCYFADDQAIDEVWAAFGEIAEERLSGVLPETEARQLEQRLRSSPGLRELFENEKALHDYVARITGGVSR